jgi:tetratricopeptide (TPR) repeat protein
MQYKSVLRPLPEIARELNVDAVVEGSVLRAGQRVRLTVELVEAATDTNLWARSYERDLEDILTLQSDLARAIATEIQGKLNPRTEARLAASRQIDPEAYEAYLKGRFYWNRRTEETLRRGIDYFNKAIEIDPTWALAYAGLADSYGILGFYFYLPPNEVFPRAKAAAERALELDEHLTEAYALLGYTELYHEWNWSKAEADFLRTLEHNPNSSDGHRYFANYLTARGRVDEAAEEIVKACRLDPLSLINSAAVGWVFYFRREFGRAIEELRKTQDMDRTFALGRLYKAWSLLQAQRLDEALVEFEKADTLAGRVPLTVAFLAHARAVAGDCDEARRLLDELTAKSKRRYVSPLLIALVHLGLGNTEATFEWLERACEERAHWLVFLDMDPRFDPIRSDPRFESLRQRVGLDASDR